MRYPLVAFFAGLVAGLIVLAGFFLVPRFSHACPCGFVWDNQANGCVVDINGAHPCFPGAGGGQGPAGAPPSDLHGSLNIPNNGAGFTCPGYVLNCRAEPDWTGVAFDVRPVSKFGPGAPGPSIKVDLTLVARDSAGKGCFEAHGTITTPRSPMTVPVPFDAGTIAGTYPDLKSSSRDGCQIETATLIAFPDVGSGPAPIPPNGARNCGCSVLLTR